jgi:hypothetical protein
MICSLVTKGFIDATQSYMDGKAQFVPGVRLTMGTMTGSEESISGVYD